MLAGNPNVGKSVIFNYLSGRYADVSNFPGTTLEISNSRWQGHVLTDSPGVNGLNRLNDEERIAEQAVEGADIVINVIDATRLRRDLYLTLQLIASKPTVIVLNMIDEAERDGLKIDVFALSRALGVPVIPAAAVDGRGLAELVNILNSWCRDLPRGVVRELAAKAELRAHASALANNVQSRRRHKGVGLLDLLLTRPLPGLPVMLAVLAAIYWLIGGVVAQQVVELTEGVIMERWLLPPLVRLLSQILPPGLLQSLLVGEFGILTMALSYGIGLLLPLVFSFYLLLALLEDSGYLPRVAVLLDNTFRPLGLNGKGAIPLILGFGCVTMAVIATRMLSSRRERLILTFLLGLAVPCSAQVGVIIMLLIPLGYKWVLAYGAMLVAIFLLAGRILNRVLGGSSPGLFLELPRLRLPRPGNVLRKSYVKSKNFLREALPLFALGAGIVTILNWTGTLSTLQQALMPLTEGWLGLPAESVNAFIMGIIRRDFGAAGLFGLNLAANQTFVALMVMTLFVPCIATVLVTIKEQGLAVALTMWAGSLAVAVFVGGLLALVI